MARRESVVCALGVYYVSTGLAPFISRRAFEAVTGRKREWWLVEAVGVVVTAAGCSMVSAVIRDRLTPEITALATGCAAGLAAIDVTYVARGRLPRSYLLDAAVEAAALVLLAAEARRARRSSDRRR